MNLANKFDVLLAEENAAIKEKAFAITDVVNIAREMCQLTVVEFFSILVHVDVPTLFILISRDPFPAKYVNERYGIVCIDTR